MIELPSSVTSQRKVSQRGVSLVELLIGITLGLLIVVAALGTLAYTQVTSTTVGDSALLQQKATSAFRTIGFQLRQAGGIEVTASPGTGALSFSTAWPGYGGAGFVAVTGTNGGGPLGTDTLGISYEDNGATRDCLGNLPIATAGQRVDSLFSVVLVGGAGMLQCTDSNGNTQILIDGVEDFQVTYGSRIVQTPAVAAVLGPLGVPTRAPRQPEATLYQEFPNANAAAAFGVASVIPPAAQSVTVCLQLRGGIRTDAPPPAGAPVQGCTNPLPNDGFIRRVYRNTYGLRTTLL